MWCLLAISNILIYMLYPVLGTVMTCGVIIYRIRLVIKKTVKLEQELFNLLIYLLPFSYAPLFGRGSHIFSAYNIIVLITIIYGVYCKIKSADKIEVRDKVIFAMLVIYLALQVVLSENMIGAFVEGVQMIQMIVLVIAGITINKYNPLSNEEVTKKAKMYIEVVFGTAIALIIQYVADKYLGVSLGNITRFPARTVYDLIFLGYSVLSMYLGSGIIMIYIYTKGKLKIKDIGIITIMLISINFNSSRTGLYGCVLILGLMIVKSIIKNRTSKEIITALVILAIGLLAITILSSNREFSGIFNLNGRGDISKEGLEIFIQNPIFGKGLTQQDYKVILPHNFIIQYLMQMGIIGMTLVSAYLGKVIYDLRITQFKYLNYYILICGLFVTDIHANTFYAIIIIIGYLSLNIKEKSDFLIDYKKGVV